MNIEFSVYAVLCVASILLTWFHSGAPMHVSNLFLKGSHKHHDRDEWEIWINTVHPVLGELLTCSVCLSWHVSFWTCLVLGVLLKLDVWTIVLTFLVCPFLSNLLIKIYAK